MPRLNEREPASVPRACSWDVASIFEARGVIPSTARAIKKKRDTVSWPNREQVLSSAQ